MKISVGFILALLCFNLCSCKSEIPDNLPFDESSVVLDKWQFYTGENVLDSTAWQSINSPKDIPKDPSGKTIWIRTFLPQWYGTSPALYIGQVDYSFQVYQNGKLIYLFGDLSSFADSKFMGRNQNLVGLPNCNKEDIISIRIKPAGNSIGFHGKVMLGSASKIVSELFNRNIFRLYFAGISFLTGIICLLIVFKAAKWKLLFGIAFFLIPLAFFILSNSLFLQMMYPAPSLYNHVNFISLVAAKVGGFFALEEIVPARNKNLFRFLRYLNVFTLITGIILNLFTGITYLDVLPYFLIQTFIDMLIVTIVFIKEAKTGISEIKILMIGFSAFFFFATLEIILYFTTGLYPDFGYNVRSLYFGVFSLVLSLIWIAVQRYLNTIKQKEAYQQKQLEAVKRENEARQQFAVNLIESQENERNRIALELHDSVGQKLLLIRNQLLLNIQNRNDDKEEYSIKDIANLTGETINEIRTITYNLRPQYLDQLGLTAAIETVVEKMGQSSKIKFHLNLDEIDNLFPKSHEINFFRIVQECLNNIIKHSCAANAFIDITRDNNEIYLSIKDDGNGNNKPDNTVTGNLGLVGMRERAGMIGADLSININGNSGSAVIMKYNIDQQFIPED